MESLLELVFVLEQSINVQTCSYSHGVLHEFEYFQLQLENDHFHVGLHRLTNQNQGKEMDDITINQELKEYPFLNVEKFMICHSSNKCRFCDEIY